MSFPWLSRTQPSAGGADRRDKVAADELASRAGLLFRLGYSEAEATQRLIAHVAWEYDQPQSHYKRPDGLSDQAIATLVTETYKRRPG
ncbi:MAG: hypothetical protein SFX73_14200 [Kofleriaceae bacterium]|nr:hypothetical protein [Kofleriaceae bacterium]